MKKSVVAIDGPAGAGKSTIAQMVAKKLGYVYIDTGAMYRAVAWKVLQSGQPVTDALILKIIDDTNISLENVNGQIYVKVDGTDVTGQLRTPAVTGLVSRVAQLAPVREKMVLLQREMARNGAVVMDGRDIASHVLPEADVKVFLTASIEERAKRRWQEVKDKGYVADLEELKKEIINYKKLPLNKLKPGIKRTWSERYRLWCECPRRFFWTRQAWGSKRL